MRDGRHGGAYDGVGSGLKKRRKCKKEPNLQQTSLPKIYRKRVGEVGFGGASAASLLRGARLVSNTQKGGES